MNPGRDALAAHPALGLLMAAVPMAISEMRALSWDARIRIGQDAADFLCEHGDDLLFRSAMRGRSAAAFGHLTRALAVAAGLPGGVTFAGMHWCPDHAECQAAAEAAGMTVPHDANRFTHHDGTAEASRRITSLLDQIDRGLKDETPGATA